MQRLLSRNKLLSLLAGRPAISHPRTSPSSPAHAHPWPSPTNPLSPSPRPRGFFSKPMLAKKPSHDILSYVSRRAFAGVQRLRCSSFDKDSWNNSAWWFRKYYLANLKRTKNAVLGLIITNITVFLLWRVLDSEFMMKNFTSSVENYRGGRLHRLMTSAFSHMHLGHIIQNMIGLHYFGIYLGTYLGPEMVLLTYIGAGMFGYLLYITSCSRKDPDLEEVPTIPALGASGAVDAIILLGLSLYPHGIISVNNLQVPALLLGSYFIGKDIWEMLQGDTPVPVLFGGAMIAAGGWAAVHAARMF